MKKYIQFAALAALLTISGTASAALHSIHWKSSGDNLVTLDDTTGIEWLDLSQTINMSISAVLAQLGPNGTYAGWRLPTKSEVHSLHHSNFGTPMDGFSMYSKPSAIWTPRADSFHAFFGLTSSTLDGAHFDNHSYGMFVGDDGKISRAGVRRAYLPINSRHDTWWGVGTLPSALNIGHVEANTGVYLVSDGGVSWSSIRDPQLNINNPASPINNATDVPAIAGGLPVFFAFLLRTRRYICRARR